ncbi:MAG TPA: hypothetical protein PKC54_02460 [Ferruginibacter sp.]|nr:hypothetical protein [Ferruginibacter sp.]
MESTNDILNELKELSPVLATMEKVNVFTVPEGYFERLSGDIMAGIGYEKESITAIPPALKTEDVPEGYFENLADTILAKVKGENVFDELKTLSPMLYSIQNENVFDVPQGYFEGLSDAILAKVKNENAADELKTLSPMLYSIQNENVFEVPQGYFESLGQAVISRVQPQAKVVVMKRRTTTFFKYAVAAVFTGVMALGVFKFTNPSGNSKLPEYVTAGLKIDDVDQELSKLSDDEIVKYLEASGSDVKTALVANSVDANELPSEEEYLLDEKALDNYLNSINLGDAKN